MQAFLLLLLLWPLHAPADSSRMVMNGYTLAQFPDFTKEWRLVTVRFRKDSGEQRFTYANEAAWQVLSAGRTDYPDGAIFAKLSILTAPDPDFESSAVPSRARRIQFMVRDKKRHADTDGWGYALFDTQGKLYPGEVSTQTVACAACHKLVPHRAFVFSQPLDLSSPLIGAKHSASAWLSFENRPVKGLPQSLRSLLTGELSQNTQIRALPKSPLTKHVFFGTLDEIRPLLAKEVAASGQPAALVSDAGQEFTLVTPDTTRPCGPGQIGLKSHSTIQEKKKWRIQEFGFCHDK